MTAVATVPINSEPVDSETITQQEAEQFLYREARLADTHDYDGWEALWTDDAIYWVPAGGESAEDPTTQVSVLFDNRSRIGTRIRQLKSGKRHSQTPKSNVVHQITNVEVLGLHENGDTEVCRLAARGGVARARHHVLGRPRRVPAAPRRRRDSSWPGRRSCSSTATSRSTRSRS